MIEIVDKEIANANNRLRQLETSFKKMLDEKEAIFETTQPKASKIEGERVQGGETREERFEEYMIACDDPRYQELEIDIDATQRKIFCWVKWIDNMLKENDEYDMLKDKIVLLVNDNRSWEDIEKITRFNKMQCQHIYKLSIGKRNLTK
jgi:hypothetical protein